MTVAGSPEIVVNAGWLMIVYFALLLALGFSAITNHDRKK
jgi:hypothetical protein